MKTMLLTALSIALAVNDATAQAYTFSTIELPPGDSRWPMSIAVDAACNLYLTHFDNHSVWKLPPGGSPTILAGHSNQFGSVDGFGGEARFSSGSCALAVASDAAGNIIVADCGNNMIRRITPDGVVSTLAGKSGTRGATDGVGEAARFNLPSGVAVDRHGNVFVADLLNHTIRKITPAGVVTTLAGVAESVGSADGMGAAARFSWPVGVAVDDSGNVYVASYDNTVRRVSPAGVVTTVAGRSQSSGYVDDPGADARFNFFHSSWDAVPIGIALNHSGNIIVADSGNRVLRRITPSGTVTTFGQSLQLLWPAGISVHGSGELYILDAGTARIVKAVPVSTLTLDVAPQSQTIAPEGTVTFTAIGRAAGGVTYQWFKDETPLTGATHATLVIRSVRHFEAGTYRCVVTETAGSAIETSATLTVLSAADPGRLVNFSARSQIGATSPHLLMGVTVTGLAPDEDMPVLLRAAGPALARFGITDFLPDPELALSAGTNLVSANDDWGGDPLVTARGSDVGAFAYPSPGSRDAAIAVALVPHSYFVRINGKIGAGGTVLGEIFDGTPASARSAVVPRFSNFAARHRLAAAGDVLIAGFNIGGKTARTLLIRAVGPSLEAFGVSEGLTDPVLQLYAGSALIRENNDWDGDGQIAHLGASVHAFPLRGPGSSDAALLVTLPPGSYTAQVRGVTSGAGEVLVEIYEVP